MDQKLIRDEILHATSVEEFATILEKFGVDMDVSTQSFFLAQCESLRFRTRDWEKLYDLTPEDSILEHAIESLLHFSIAEIEEGLEEQLFRRAHEDVKLPKRGKRFQKRRS